MKLIPLGGAEEVGATCTLLEIGGHKILVDAGIRLGQPDALPDLGRISDFGGIEAILVTHAHTDHTGALPVVHRAFPNVPIYTTPGTQAIVNVLFNDALNIMKNRYEVDREIPLYTRELVDSLFTRVQPVQLGQTLTLFGGDLAATFFPAGHILGAACIGLQGANGESAFISGDISVTPQLTVGGMLPPVSIDRRFRPQVVMVESTYGNRMHANRATEERRLVETVAEVIESGGRVLIPAFAVGRAQEILLILASAMARKVIAPFPVWIDGMVRSVCGVYTQHPYDLATALRKQILRHGNPFWGDEMASGKAIEFVPIQTPQERQRLAEDARPGCIVASSGMLSGGPSAYYARYIARESKSAIFITGYQDEESPGRALLALAEATDPAERVLKLEGETVAVECQVGKYSLSAHVDAGEVAALIEGLDPQETVLVHGAGGAREALSDLLIQSKDRRVYLPRAADELTFAPRRTAARKRQLVAPPSPADSEAENLPARLPATAAELGGVRETLVAELGERLATGRSLTVQEVARLWLAQTAQSNASLDAEGYSQLRLLLHEKASGFVPDNRRPFLYRLARHADGLVKNPTATAVQEAFPLEQNQALKIVDEIFPPAEVMQSGLYKRGANLAERKLLLSFHFPDPARQRYSDQLEELATRTGWAIELNTEAHQVALANTFSRALPPGWLAVKPPAIYRELAEVRVTLARGGGPEVEAEAELEPDWEALRRSYQEQTGYRLLLTLPGAPSAPAQPSPPLPPGAEARPKMEINAAFALLDRRFEEAGGRPLRRSLKNGQFIELSFVTAPAGEHYRPLLEALAYETGWPIRINPEPHHQALQSLTEGLVGEWPGLIIRKFSIHRDRNEIGLKLGGLALDETQRAKLEHEFQAQTGWTLRLSIENN